MIQFDAIVEWLVAKSKQPKVQRLALVAASCFFCIALYWAVSERPLTWDMVLSGQLYILLFALIPGMIVLNGLELKYASSLIGVTVRYLKALKISVVASAANMLPLPGGPLVRIGSVVSEGKGVKKGFLSVIVPAFFWLGLSLLAAAAAGAIVGQTLIAITMLLAGLLALATGWRLGGRQGTSKQTKAILMIVKAVGVAAEVLAMKFAFELIGVEVGLSQVIFISASSAIAAVTMIFPAGLGIREALAAGLGVAVGVPVAASILAASIVRLASIAVLVPTGLVLSTMHATSVKNSEK